MAIDLGDSINRDLGYDLPVVKLSTQIVLANLDVYTKRCFSWSDFKQEGWEKEQESFKYTITGEEAAQKAVKMVFQISPWDDSHRFNNIIEVIQTYDKKLIKLNNSNKSQLIAFVGYFLGFLLSKKYVAVSNQSY